ncbi:glycosyltransferase [Marinomonas sp. TW1]|uniref:glycosyltransferase n=1 Tax=Marinomonas sp. TW1 TaxID=1561203 RepID=UPI0007AF356A|nr:glycosyltransferase [Marinomonas sp. TW1]
MYMNIKPEVTVYIPTFNRVEMLKRAVKSVLDQSFSSFEVIVVDDCSSDGTIEFLDAIGKIDSRVRYFQNSKNSGACVSRNKAIKEARGKFITGLDDDDEFMPHHLEVLVRSFDEKYSFISVSILEDVGKGRIERSVDCGLISLDRLLHYNAVGNQVFTLTSRMRSINGFDESFPAFQDYDTWIRLVLAYGSGKKIKQATYIWHTAHEQERISHNKEKRLLALDLFLKKNKRYMSKSHFKSVYIMKKKIENTEFTILSFLLNVNKFNFRSAVSTFLNIRLPKIAQGLREYKKR